MKVTDLENEIHTLAIGDLERLLVPIRVRLVVDGRNGSSSAAVTRALNVIDHCGKLLIAARGDDDFGSRKVRELFAETERERDRPGQLVNSGTYQTVGLT